MRAIVLLSGGLDSATCLHMALQEGRDVEAMWFGYGQRHAFELQAARAIAERVGVPLFELQLPTIQGSALTTPGATIPPGGEPGIPSTYVPARNTIFLAFALSRAEAVEADEIWCGVSAVDYSGYPDCRPAYFEAWHALSRYATKRGVSGRPIITRTPLISLSKAETIKRGVALGVPYHLTHSCYDPHSLGGACGRCDACHLRRNGFTVAGIDDPTWYGPEATI